MRSIMVSTEVFSKLWSDRQNGEESEDDILRRLLGCAPAVADDAGRQQGYVAEDGSVALPEGFEIFRTYKGTEYRAVATGGRWSLEDGRMFRSLHKLSAAIVNSRENAWNGWKYLRDDGTSGTINELRDPGKVRRRGD